MTTEEFKTKHEEMFDEQGQLKLNRRIKRYMSKNLEWKRRVSDLYKPKKS